MSPPTPSNPTTVKCNIPEAQDKDFKIVILNMLEVLKEDKNFTNKVYENTNNAMI